MLQYLRLLHRGIRRTMISACLPRWAHGRQRHLSRSWSDGVIADARAIVGENQDLGELPTDEYLKLRVS